MEAVSGILTCGTAHAVIATQERLLFWEEVALHIMRFNWRLHFPSTALSLERQVSSILSLNLKNERPSLVNLTTVIL